MTKYLLHGMTCNIAELLHSCGLMHSASPRATILQCRMAYHVISIYYQAADQDRKSKATFVSLQVF